MILNGKDTPLGSGAQFVPDVSNGVMNLMQNVTVGVMQKVNLNGYATEIPLYISTMATKEPFSAQQLEIKPEGQRAWSWFRMRILIDVILKTDDRFVMNDLKYRVMRSSEYTEYGYNEYDVVLDYQ